MGDAANLTYARQPFTDPGSCASVCPVGAVSLERQVAVHRVPGPVDLVKVSHHGSADQSPALYDRLDAVVGLIGVGADNGYGHPTARLLGILSAAGTTALRTDLRGLVLVSATDDGGVSVWTERVGPGG